VTFLINYEVGGSTDIEGRLVARYLAKHIPGHPNLIVRNMGGGGGLTATNYMGQVTPNDPTQLAFFTWNPVQQLLGAEALRVKYNEFKMVAAFPQPVVVYIRKDVPPGIEKPADIVKAKSFYAAGFNPLSHGYLRQLLSLDILGVKNTPIAGYRGNNDVELAIQRGEAQLSNNSLPGYRGTVEPILVKTGIVLPLYQFDTQAADGSFQGSAALPEVPTFLDVYKQLHGKTAMPSGPRWDTLVMISNIMDSMYRAVFLPPGVPNEAVADMRAAFASLASDPEFLETYSTLIGGAKPSILPGERAQTIIAGLADVDPKITDFLKPYVQEKTLAK
jgi:hypothetical protein